jgi:hypothetical protein
MVKVATLAVTVAAFLPALTAAASCTDGLVYCGYNLLKKGRGFEAWANCS